MMMINFLAGEGSALDTCRSDWLTYNYPFLTYDFILNCFFNIPF